MNGTATRVVRRWVATWSQHCRSSSGRQTIQRLGESQITNESDGERYCHLYIYDANQPVGLPINEKLPLCHIAIRWRRVLGRDQFGAVAAQWSRREMPSVASKVLQKDAMICKYFCVHPSGDSATKLRHQVSLGDDTGFITTIFAPSEQSGTADSSDMLIRRA